MRILALDITGHDPELITDRCWAAGVAGVWEHSPQEWRIGVDPLDVTRVQDQLTDLSPVDVTEAVGVELATRTVSVDLAGHDLTLTVPPTVFGDGGHETTRLCAEELAALLTEADRGPGATVLDVGSGAGALSVVAARCGAEVRAIDIDPVAVAATVDNAAAHDVVVRADDTPLAALDERFDVIVANVVIGALRPLLADIVKRLESTGVAVLAGMLDTQWPEVESSLPTRTVRTRSAGGWTVAVVTTCGAAGSGTTPN